eukprot:scaffold6385_cov207-Chaetoceros_neogracile.AAC.3
MGYDRCTEELNVEACSFDGGACKALDGSTASISALCDDLRDKYRIPNVGSTRKNADRTREIVMSLTTWTVIKSSKGKDHQRAYRTRVLNINRRMCQNQQSRKGRCGRKRYAKILT